jgi:hypothetical protein
MFVRKCGAKARTNGHRPCRQPAMTNGRCRLHGGKCTGPKTEEGRYRIKKANLKHGFYSADEIEERKAGRALIKEMKLNIQDVY